MRWMRRRLGWGLLSWAVLLVSAVGCSDGKPEILVFAAASLADALDEVGTAFEREADVGVAFSYGGSMLLAQQVAKGARPELLIAAGEFPVAFLQERGLVDGEPIGILGNSLVVVSRDGGPDLSELQALRGDAVSRVALADPETAPAGRYARESLSQAGLWEDLRPKVIFGHDVRVTIGYVESGNADAAIVYRTDAIAVGAANVLDIVPPGSYSPIVYPAAIIAGSGQRTLAGRFVDFLQAQEARAIFHRHGFDLLEQ